MTHVRARRIRLYVPLALALGLAILAACNGGTTPALSLGAVPNQATTLGEPLVVPLTVTHASPAEVFVAATSSDQDVVPDSGLQVTGSGVNRTLTITPSSANNGTAVITVVATDQASQTATRQFDVVVEVPFEGREQVLEPESGDPIGVAVAIDGGTAVVGGLLNAYVFELEGGSWVERQKLQVLPDVNLQNDDPGGFGEAVAVGGGRVLVGAPTYDVTQADQGIVYVYEGAPGTFAPAGELADSAPEASDLLGTSVDVSGDYLFAGAPGATEGSYASGSVLVFTPHVVETWSLLGKLTPAEGEEEPGEGDVTDAANFGEALDVSGGLLAVGDYADSQRGANAGAAYVFEQDGGFWYQRARLAPEELEEFDQFGIAVAADDGWVLVGAWNDDDEGADAGAVYVFTETAGGWEQVDKLFASDAAANASFGSGVALDYPYAVVAAKLDDEAANNAGAVYVFRHDGTTWHELVKLTSPEPGTENQFGWDVDISGNHVIVSQLGATPLAVVYRR